MMRPMMSNAGDFFVYTIVVPSSGFIQAELIIVRFYSVLTILYRHALNIRFIPQLQQVIKNIVK